MMMGCLKAVGGGMEKSKLLAVLRGVRLLAPVLAMIVGVDVGVLELEPGCANKVDGGVRAIGDLFASARVLVLASRSYAVPSHSQACHGQTQPSSFHGHLCVSRKSETAKRLKTMSAAHEKPMMAFVT